MFSFSFEHIAVIFYLMVKFESFNINQQFSSKFFEEFSTNHLWT